MQNLLVANKTIAKAAKGLTLSRTLSAVRRRASHGGWRARAILCLQKESSVCCVEKWVKLNLTLLLFAFLAIAKPGPRFQFARASELVQDAGEADVGVRARRVGAAKRRLDDRTLRRAQRAGLIAPRGARRLSGGGRVDRGEESDDGGEHAVELDRSALEGSLVEDGSAQNEAQTLAIVLSISTHVGSQRDAF